MTDDQILAIANEVIQDLQVSTNLDKTKRHVREAEYSLKDLVGRDLKEDLNPDENLNVRCYLINYSRYAFYGIIDEFSGNYRDLIGRIQIEAGI